MAKHQGQRPAAPLRWRVNNLELAGLSWGEPDGKPLLALHGWLDNAASFASLGPLLAGYHVVAPDLSGHGQSARRSDDASYQIWDDLPEILGVVDALGWDTFALMGHSRGAIIATLLAAAFPERVTHLILLDAVSPAPVAEQNFPSQMRKALEDKSRLLARPNRVFASFEEAVASREGSNLSGAAASLLVARNLRDCPEGLTLTTDARLRGASAVKMSAGQIRAVLHALRMPTLLLLAGDTTYQPPELAEYARSHIAGLTVSTIAGGHHFHMESRVGEVAQQIERFFTGTNQCKSA